MATLRQLKVFATVAECMKMSEAAKKLYISQPTVSQIIADLEKEYHVELFQRFPKELKITSAGQLLLSNALEIISLHENLEQSMKNIHSLRPLRIGATLTIGNTLISTLAENLLKKHPDIDISVFIDNTSILEHRMMHNELDIALIEGMITRKEIYTEPVIDDRLELICSKNHPFADRESIFIEELRGQNFIMRERGSGTRAIFENLLTAQHIPFHVKWECSCGTAIVDAVRHNLGLGVLSYRCIEDYAARGEIKICSLNGISMKRFFYICYNKTHPVTSQMQDFISEAKLIQSSEL